MVVQCGSHNLKLKNRRIEYCHYVLLLETASVVIMINAFFKYIQAPSDCVSPFLLSGPFPVAFRTKSRLFQYRKQR